MYRALAHMSDWTILPSDYDKNRSKYIVTWTLKSLHIINLEDQYTINDKSNAFDFAIMKGQKPTWDIKADVNLNNLPDYREAGNLATQLGLLWGGNFKSPDFCHVQVRQAELDGEYVA